MNHKITLIKKLHELQYCMYFTRFHDQYPLHPAFVLTVTATFAYPYNLCALENTSETRVKNILLAYCRNYSKIMFQVLSKDSERVNQKFR